MAAESGAAREIQGLLAEGGTGGGTAAGSCRAPPLVVLSAGCLLGILGLSVAGQLRISALTGPGTLAKNDSRLEAKWLLGGPIGSTVRPPEFRRVSISTQDGLCLGADQEGGEGALVSIHECWGKPSTWTWETTRGTLRHEDGLCLDTPHPGRIGAKVHLWRCIPGLSHQMWNLIAGKGILRNTVTGKCVRADSPGGDNAQLTIQECHGGSQQWRWQADPADEEDVSPGFLLRNGWNGKIRNKQGICMKAEHPNKNGSAIIMENCDSEEDGMYWSYAGTTSSLVSRGGLCLDINRRWAQTSLHLWQCYPDLNAQKFNYDPRTGLISSWGGHCIDAPEASVKGNFVQDEPCTLHPAQQWVLQG